MWDPFLLCLSSSWSFGSIVISSLSPLILRSSFIVYFIGLSLIESLCCCPAFSSSSLLSSLFNRDSRLLATCFISMLLISWFQERVHAASSSSAVEFSLISLVMTQSWGRASSSSFISLNWSTSFKAFVKARLLKLRSPSMNFLDQKSSNFLLYLVDFNRQCNNFSSGSPVSPLIESSIAILLKILFL